jgi:hypothetical protein
VAVIVAEVTALVALIVFALLVNKSALPNPAAPTTAKASTPVDSASVPAGANAPLREPDGGRNSDPPRAEPEDDASPRTAERDQDRATQREQREPVAPPVTSAPTLPLLDVRAAVIRAEAARREAPPAAPAASPSPAAVDSVRGILAEAVKHREAGNYASAFATFRTAQTRLAAMRAAYPLSYTTAALDRQLADQLRATVTSCQAYRDVRVQMGFTAPDCNAERR